MFYKIKKKKVVKTSTKLHLDINTCIFVVKRNAVIYIVNQLKIGFS